MTTTENNKPLTNRPHELGGPHFQRELSRTVYTRVIDAIKEPGLGLPLVAAYLQRDQLLTEQVIAHVNSASFAPARKITSLREAVILLGAEGLRELLGKLLPEPAESEQLTEGSTTVRD